MANTDSNIAHQVLAGLTRPIAPVIRSGNYKSGTMLAAVVMVFMFMSYIAMLTTLFWMMLNMLFSIFAFGFAGGPSLLGVMSYMILLAMGGSVFLALVKPLFVGSHQQNCELQLHPKQESFLFEYVHRICKAVGSPAPDEIVVDHRANAGAGFVNGTTDQRLRLVLGLPLLLSLDTRQIAGVIAHEFGHFSQTTGMKLTYLIRSMEQWLNHAANDQDAWDEKVARMRDSSQPPVTWFFAAIEFAVQGSKFVLIGLSVFGHFFVARLLQEMEFDADRHQARLAGSDNFVKTSRRMRLLSISEAQTIEDLEHYRRMKQLPDNLPALLVDNERQIDMEQFRELEAQLLKVDTHWTDTHPCDRERIENAVRESAPGVFHVEQPATVLFSDIDALCRIVTLELYRDFFGSKFNSSHVKVTGDLLASREVRRGEGKAALRFVLEQFCGYDTLLLPRAQLGVSINGAQFQDVSKQRRDYLMHQIRAYAKLRQQEDQTWKEMVHATCAKRLIEAGFNLATAGNVFSTRTIQETNYKITQHTRVDQQLKAQLAPFRQVIGQRVMDALEFMRSREFAESNGEAPNVADEIRSILGVWNRVVSLRPTFESFFFESHVTVMLLKASGRNIPDRTMRSINAALQRLTHAMTVLQQSTTDLMFPFEHGLGQISLAHYLVPELPDAQDIAETMGATDSLDKNLEYLLRRCVARLGALAEKSETAFGFPPLEVPAEVRILMNGD